MGILERIVNFLFFKILKIELNDCTKGKIIQFIKYAIAGVVSNAIYYLIYVVLVEGIGYCFSNIIGFFVSIMVSFWMNNRYVFGGEEIRIWWKTLFKTSISYIFTGVILSNVLMYIFIDNFSISEYIAPFLCLIILIPLNYLINKYWAYRTRQ